MHNYWKQPDYTPSPKEIEQKCEEIRRGWSEIERRRRMRFYAADTEYAKTREVEEIVEIEPRPRVPHHPDILEAGQQRAPRVSSSMLGV